MGRKYSVTTGRFREAKFHRPLSDDEFEEVTVASRPKAAPWQFSGNGSSYLRADGPTSRNV